MRSVSVLCFLAAISTPAVAKVVYSHDTCPVRITSPSDDVSHLLIGGKVVAIHDSTGVIAVMADANGRLELMLSSQQSPSRIDRFLDEVLEAYGYAPLSQLDEHHCDQPLTS